MVTFNKDSFTITINTGTNPIEGWQELHSQLLRVLSSMDDSYIYKPYFIYNLIDEMMPDLSVLKKNDK